MRFFLLAFLAVGLSGCATPGSQFPVVAATMQSDATADCSALLSELERVAVLRREIASEQVSTGTEDVANVMMSTIMNPLGGLADAAVRSGGAAARNEQYDRAADAADRRIAVLMTLRSQRSCAQSDPELALMSTFASHASETPKDREEREQAVTTYLLP